MPCKIKSHPWILIANNDSLFSCEQNCTLVSSRLWEFHNVVGEIVIVFFPLETAIHIEKQQESRLPCTCYILKKVMFIQLLFSSKQYHFILFP